MSASDDPRADYPVTLRHSMRQSNIVYERSTELFAWLRRHRPDDPQRMTHAGPAPASDGPQDQSVSRESGVDPEFSLQDEDGTHIDVYRGPVDPARAGPDVGAVYVERGSRRIVVPTGRVLARFAVSVPAQSRRVALQAAGYRIVAILAYAPHCAWVESTSGDAARSLQGIARLEALDDIDNVEPQWLSPRAAK